MTASTTTPASPTPPKRLTTAEVDVLRVRALQGDPLAEVREPTREWVWRSLLLGTHLQVCAERAGLASEAARAAALDRVRGWYRARLAAYHQARPQSKPSQ